MNAHNPAFCFLLTTALTLPAQALPEGYASRTRLLPANAGNVLELTGATVWFDGQDLMLSGSGPQRSLLHFAIPVFGSFTIPAGPGQLLFGESSTGSLWLVPIHGPRPTQSLTHLQLNYDAVMWDPGTAIVSAKTAGFSAPLNDLVAVDLGTGATQLLAQLPGASGPLAIDAGSHLYYATSSMLFPTPPGQMTVLRFRRNVVDQARLNQQVLGVAQAETVLSGLDAASDLAFDGDGDLFYVDWLRSVIGEINDADGPNPTHRDLIDYAGAPVSGSSLQFRGPPGQRVFEPFQSFSGSLSVHETDFGTVSQVRWVSTASATMAASTTNPIASGTFSLQVTGGPAAGAGLIAIALSSGPPIHRIDLAGFEQPLFWHAALLQPANTHFVSFDASGSAGFAFTNPGFTPSLSILTQAAFLGAQGMAIGDSAPLHLTLSQ